VRRAAKSDEDRPDIAIEVVWTSGGINKLEVCKLGVPDQTSAVRALRTALGA
jgi:hypothetical protein